jgi:hypothetical protein
LTCVTRGSQVLNNASVAAQIAVALSSIRSAEMAGMPLISKTVEATRDSDTEVSNCSPVVVVGGATIDIMSSPAPGTRLLPRTSSPGVVTQRPGGVGRNIAESIARMTAVAGSRGGGAVLVSAVGADLAGDALLADCATVGIEVGSVLRCTGDEGRTAVYASMHDENGDLSAGTTLPCAQLPTAVRV